MKVLKGCALALLSFILLILLTVFGLAFTVHQTVLNPNFVNSVINDIDFSDTVREILTQQSSEPPSPELVNAIVTSLDKAEPAIKKSLNTAVDDAYDYLLGKTRTLNLRGTLRDSVMNSRFLDSMLQSIDLSKIVEQSMQSQSTGSTPEEQAFTDSMIAAIDKLEPSLKTQIVAVSDPIFKYILSDTNSIDLKTTLRTTLLNKSFLTEVFNDLDIKTLTSDMVGNDLNTQLPDSISLTREEEDRIISALEPAVKQGLTDAADPMADYLVGLRSDFSVNVSMSTIMTGTVKPIVKEAYLRQLPPELISATAQQKDAAFEIYWLSAQGNFPDSFIIDSSMFSEGAQESLDKGLTSLQESLTGARDGIAKAEAKMVKALEQPRQYIHYFQLAYWGIIILLLLLIGGIILIHRSVRGASRTLGITFTIYGAIWFATAVVLKMIFGKAAFWQRSLEADTPQFVRDMMPPIIQKVTQPLFIFTLIVLILGIGLLVLSFVYPEKKPAEPVTAEAVKQ